LARLSLLCIKIDQPFKYLLCVIRARNKIWLVLVSMSIALFITSKQYSLLYNISAYHLKLSTSFVGNDFCGVRSLAHYVSQCRLIADSVLAAASPFLMSPPRQGSFLSHSWSTAVPHEIKDSSTKIFSS
jgi:hypothetical protein